MATGSATVIGGIVILGLLGLSAFFSSSETAIFTLTDEWVDERVADGAHGAAALQALRADPHRLLVTILVGNNVVNVAIASITTALLVRYLPGSRGVFAATVVTSVALLVLGEIVPKSYGLGHAQGWALSVAGPIRFVERVLTPLVVVIDAVTRPVNAWLGGETDIEKTYGD